MNRFVALTTLLAVASAAPEADPQLLYGLGYHHPAITSIGALTTYTNGAVVPTNTPAVAAATAAHLHAKAADYAAHGYGFGYGLHHLGKRDADAKADADPYLLYGHGLYGYPFSTYYPHAAGYASVSPAASVNIAGLAPAAVPALAGGYAGAGRYVANSGGVVHIAKREADAKADADPYLLYGHGLYGYPYGLYGAYPAVTSVGGLTTYSNGAVVPTDPANQLATAQHLAAKGFVHHLGKREAEAEADPEAYYGYAGYHAYPYGYGYGYARGPYAGAYGFTHYPNGAVVPTDPANQIATAQHLSYKFGHGFYYGK